MIAIILYRFSYLIWIILLLEESIHVLSQDNQNYYFGQNRFVPSFHNTRNGFFSSPSYQSLDVGSAAQDISPAFVPFPQYQSTRVPNFFDLSPRPFGVPAPSTLSHPSSPQLLRPSGSGGFIPSSSLTKSNRANIPHDQSQFLAKFNEQSHLSTALGTATTPEPSAPVQSNRIGRPFNGFSSGFSRNRQTDGFNRLNPVESDLNVNLSEQKKQQRQQQQPPYRSRGNRFYQPNTQSTTSSSTTTTPRIFSNTSEKTNRYNRFGTGRSSLPKTALPSSSASSSLTAPGGTISISSPFNTTLPKSKPNKILFQPRRPVFISREVNEPIHLKQSPLSTKTAIEHNGSDNNRDEEADDNHSEQEEFSAVEQDLINETNHVIDEKPVVEEITDDISFETYEKMRSKNIIQQQKDEKLNNATSEIVQNPSQEISNENDQTVILTSNFFLPDNKVLSQNTDESGKHSTEDEKEYFEHELISTTHQPTTDYDYEYEDYEEQTVSNPTTESLLRTSTSKNEDDENVTGGGDIAVTTERQNQANITDLPQPEHIEYTTIDKNVEEEMNNEEDEDGDEYESDSEEIIDDDSDSENKNLQQKSADIVGKAVVSVVTTKSVINGSTAYPQQVTPSSTTLSEILQSSNTESSEKDEKHNENENVKVDENMTEEKQNVDDTMEEEPKKIHDQMINENNLKKNQDDEVISNTTEGYVVVASIQTSRSISGARFLPFPAIEQEEKKQTLSELERKIHEKKKGNNVTDRDDDKDKSMPKDILSLVSSSPEPISTTEDSIKEIETTTEKILNQSISTESIIDKLDRVQSELSSGVLIAKFPILNEKPVHVDISSTPATSTTTLGSKSNLINIRKFMPKSSTTTSKPKIDIDAIPMDDLSGLLPPGFKSSRPNSYRNRKITTTTESSQLKINKNNVVHKLTRNSTIGRSFKNTPLVVQEVSLASLLPKGYKANNTTSSNVEIPKKILNDNSSKKLLPKDEELLVKKSNVTLIDDISKFLPPGFKLPATNKPLPVIPIQDDISKYLPPGYKPPPLETNTKKMSSLVIPLHDDIKKFVPPGYELDKKSNDDEILNISKLLPKNFKSSGTNENDNKTVDSLLKKIEFKDVSSFLPPDFKQNLTKSTESPSTAGPETGLKVVFPKGLNKRPGHRLTTPKSINIEGPQAPPIVIKKGPPTRATTEFTGWPTPSTTPISIEKLLEQQQTAKIDISDLLPISKIITTTTTTTTSTTTMEPPKPTQPGLCHSECDLAGTIKIIDGIEWKPELLDHNTIEWKSLANEVESQLNQVYSKSPYLSKWYKKTRIDSFSKGSVLVDYFVELSNITRDIDTLEIKQLFHNALLSSPTVVTTTTSSPPPNIFENDDENISEERINNNGNETNKKLVKDMLLLGRFVVDPISTDFIVIPKSISPIVEYAEEDVLLPQWAIVVIVIGAGSLCFIIIFGVTVLINRQKRAKKTPTPLTSDMLNELNKNHMGGIENYGVDEFYNAEDTWDTKQPIKPKRFTNSINDSNTSNIYDSWRSNRLHGDYYYDSHNYTPHKSNLYPLDGFSDATHQMYTYNNNNSRSGRYHRDYDPDF